MSDNFTQVWREKSSHYVYFSLSRVISCSSFFLFGFPRNNRRLIRDIKTAGTFHNYNKEYSFPSKLTISQTLVLVLNIALALKNFYPLYYIFGSINQLKSDYLNPAAQFVRYGCLETNCTSRIFLKQLTAFPVFTMCQADNHWLFPPLIGLQPNGLILQCMYVYFLVFFDIGTVLYIYFRPMFFDAHLFTLHPIVGQITNCEYLRRNFARLYLSMINLHTQCPRLVSAMNLEPSKRNPKQRPNTLVRLLKPDLKHQDLLLRTSHVYFEQSQLLKFSPKFIDLDTFARDYIYDCLTFFRSEWWHEKSVRLSFYQSVIFSGSITVYIGAGIYVVTLILRGETSNLSLMVKKIRESGCEIWLNDESVRPITESDIIKSIPSWNNLIFAEIGIGLLPGLCLSGILLSWFQLAHTELISILAEQIDRVSMTIEITRLLKANGFDSVQGSTDQSEVAEHASLYSLNELKQYHQQNKSIGKAFRFLKPYKRHSSDQTGSSPCQVAVNLFNKNGPSIAAYQELLTKIYINNSSVGVMFNRLNTNVETILLALFSITYGFVGILVYINRKFGEATEFTLLMGLWGIFLNSIMVYLPSKLHSLSRVLVGSMWRLIDANMDFKDVRVRHLRTLLLRQLGPMCRDGGLSLKAFGIPVTYGSVIKLALWSSTLIVISFNP